METGENGGRLGPTSPHDYRLVAISKTPLQTIGTNGIPTLLRLIQTHDSKSRRALLSWLDRQRWITLRALPDWEKQNRGVRGFCLLGTYGLVAVPALIRLSHNGHDDVAFTAAYALFSVLDSVRADPAVALPILRQLMCEGAPDTQLNAANTLAVWFPREAGRAGVYTQFPELRLSNANFPHTIPRAVR